MATIIGARRNSSSPWIDRCLLVTGFLSALVTSVWVISLVIAPTAVAQQYPTELDDEPPPQSESEQSEASEASPPEDEHSRSPNAERYRRQGFWGNLGVGYGSMACTDCGDRLNGAGAELALGGTINPGLLVGGASHSWAKIEDDITLTVSTLTPVIRVYPLVETGFYLIGGIGFSTMSIEFPGGLSITEDGFGAVAGVGYDIPFASRWAITPFANAMWVSISDDGIDGNFNSNVVQLGLSITFH